MRIGKMETITSILSGVGGILLGSLAISMWYGDNKTGAVWVGFVGAICFLLIGAIQAQVYVWKIEETAVPKPDLSTVQRDRAYVHVFDGEIVHQGGSAPTVTIDIKNSGNTSALDLTWTARFIVAIPDAPDSEFTFDKYDTSPAVLGPGGSMSYRYTFQNWKPEFDVMIEKRKAQFFAFGQIRYKDVFGNPRFNDYRLIGGGRFDIGKGITPGKWAVGDKGNASD